jgi:hypothetical protein
MGSAYSDVLLPHPVHFLARLTYSMERKSLQVRNSISFTLLYSSVADPDPHGSAFLLVGWIRIQEGKNDPQKKNKVNQFNFLKRWMFSSEGVSCTLDVLLGA